MIRELKTFLAVIRHGSFARAAVRIGLTQSAVSAQIQRLEEELGYPLFDRTGRSATLNERGRQVSVTAEDILAVYARLHEQAGSSGLLRIGAIASAQVSLLVGGITRFRQQWPGWQIRVVPGVSLNLMAQLDAGELDLAVMIRPPFDLPAEMRWHTVRREPFVLLAPAALAGASWRELLGSQPFIRYDRGSFGGRLVERFLRRARISVDDAVEMDELQGIVGLVESGAGVALVPHAESLLLPETVAVMALEDADFVREIGIAYRDLPGQGAVVTHFIEALGQH